MQDLELEFSLGFWIFLGYASFFEFFFFFSFFRLVAFVLLAALASRAANLFNVLLFLNPGSAKMKSELFIAEHDNPDGPNTHVVPIPLSFSTSVTFYFGLITAAGSCFTQSSLNKSLESVKKYFVESQIHNTS